MQRNLLLPLVILAVALWGCSTGGRGRHFSDSLRTSGGGLTISPDTGGLVLFQALTNSTREPVWVRVTFEAPPPNRTGKVVRRLDPGVSEWITYPQVSVVTEVDYPVIVETYRDAALTQLADRTQTKFRFAAEEAKVFDELAKGTYR